MLSEQPLAAKEKAKSRDKKRPYYYRYKYIQKLVEGISPGI